MAIITNALVQALFTGFKADFQKGLENAEKSYDKVASIIPSTTKSNTYGWIGKVPALREWIGDRVINDIKEHGYQVLNKDWESTIGVARTDIEDDEVGQYSMLFEELGRAAAVHPDDQVFNLLKAGISTLCYDGQFFFDTDHPVYANADGTGANTPTSNFDNNAGSGTFWYLLDTSRVIKPLIFQLRKKPVFTAMTKIDDEQVFTANEYRMGVDCRDNVGFGFWQMAYASRKPMNAANFNAAYAAMASYVADGGRPLGITPSLLVVPPSLREVALETVTAERNAAGATNINRNAVDVLVTPWVA